MPTNRLERRFLPAGEMRVSRNEAGAQTLAGYAAVFDSMSEDMGGWREKLAPGCFTATLATSPDVRGLVNHDPNLILGRTKSGTLTLSQDEIGLHFELSLPDTQIARDIATSIERGDIDQCSFGMIVDDASFEDAPDGSWVRTVRAASLFDVSVVTYPAYSATSVSLRSLFPDGVPDAITAQLESAVTRTAVTATVTPAAQVIAATAMIPPAMTMTAIAMSTTRCALGCALPKQARQF